MTTLIAELIELARGDGQPSRARGRPARPARGGRGRAREAPSAGRRVRHRAHESVVRGVPASLERAIGNLLDNAAKWSPPGGEVEVTVADGAVTVRDHGPGIADEDLPYVFDRFYRSRRARTLPGSGLGLAIVRQVARGARRHGRGRARRGGGTRMTLRLDGASRGRRILRGFSEAFQGA